MAIWLIPLIIFGASFLVTVVFIIWKLPALARLPEVVPVVKIERGRKEAILSSRFQRMWSERFGNFFLSWKAGWLRLKQLFFVVYRQVQQIEQRYQKQLQPKLAARKDVMQKMVWEADELFKQEKFAEAERKYIQVITWDHKNVPAYKGLAELYRRRKEYRQARDTLNHILKIEPGDAESHWQLGSVVEEEGEADRAFGHFEKALALAPNNPRYIDSLLEISIILGKKEEAWKLVGRLKEVNPDNQKLKELEEKIRQL